MTKLKVNTASYLTDTLSVEREHNGYTLEYEDGDSWGTFYISDANAEALFQFLALELTSELGAAINETLVKMARLEAEIKAQPDREGQ